MKTLAEEMRAEAERQRRQMVHLQARRRGPMSMEEAAEFHKRMEGEKE